MSPGGTIWDSNKPKEELNEFEKLLLEYDYSFDRGDIVKGSIIGFDSEGVLVDIGAKTAAKLPLREISTDYVKNPADVLEIGDEKEFYILKEENEDGQVTVSIKRLVQAYSWTKLEELKDKDEVIEAEILSTVKGGILVDVLGLRGFVPSSQLSMRDISRETGNDDIVGQKIPVKILSVDQKKNNLILSHRKVLSEQQAEQRKDIFEKIEIGSSLEGEVVRLADFGAFIDIGGIDGLLPLSQMSWRWVDHPSDILTVGDKVSVQIIGIDYDKHRVSLSLKTQQNDPWDEVGKVLKENDEVKGKITRIKHFGAFVEVFPGVEALLPAKEVGDFERAEGKQLQVGDEIMTTILRFAPEDRRISLSFNFGR